MAPDDPRRVRYDRLSREAAEHIRRGEFDLALALYRDARSLSDALKDPALRDEALTNLSMAYLEAGDVARASEGLREVILRSRSDLTIHHAAYNLAIALRREGRYDRALFYARLSIRKANESGDLAGQARCHNLLGNIHVNLSALDEALAEYRRALVLRRKEPGDNRFSLAILLENLGYCRLLRGERKPGVRLLLRALGMARDVGDRRCQADCLQDLSYAALLDRDPLRARRYGMRSLALARQMSYADVEKNCYFLLGEAAQRLGDEAACERWFQRLQSYYPHIENLTEFLKAFDVTQVLNLKA
jgi:tetratricopeptide (TPR) repeat protein